jgi:hypothetical protein
MAPFTARGLTTGYLAFAFAFAIGCGSATPRLEAGVYREGAIAFRVGDVPSAWRAVHVDGATLAYRDEAHRASILLDGRCYRKDDDVPLLALTDHLVMGTTGREFASQDTLSFDGRDALHSRLRAKLDGVPMDYDIFVLKKDGCVYDFVYVAEPGPTSSDANAAKDATKDAVTPAALDDGTSAFERFTGTFHTLAGAASASHT